MENNKGKQLKRYATVRLIMPEFGLIVPCTPFLGISALVRMKEGDALGLRSKLRQLHCHSQPFMSPIFDFRTSVRAMGNVDLQVINLVDQPAGPRIGPPLGLAGPLGSPLQPQDPRWKTHCSGTKGVLIWARHYVVILASTWIFARSQSCGLPHVHLGVLHGNARAPGSKPLWM